MLIDRQELAALIPHAGAMCLLDSVSHWTQDEIVCHSASHHSRDNPLRRDGRLSALHACEYGAQAMAVHGGLLARAQGERLGGGFLVALRNVQLEVEHLDDVDPSLRVEAQRLLADGGNLMYQFNISAGGKALVSGRATVVAQEERDL